MTDRTFLLEAVPYGTAFFDTMNKGYMGTKPVFFPFTLDKAAKYFIVSLVTRQTPKLEGDPIELVQELVKHHGLVVMLKAADSVRTTMQKLPKKPGIEFEFVLDNMPDGFFTLNNMKALVARGNVQPTTKVRVDVEGHTVLDFTEAQFIDVLRPFFSLASLGTRSSVTVVAKDPKSVLKAAESLAILFDVYEEDSVFLCASLEDADNGHGRETTLERIKSAYEKQPTV